LATSKYLSSKRENEEKRLCGGPVAGLERAQQQKEGVEEKIREAATISRDVKIWGNRYRTDRERARREGRAKNDVGLHHTSADGGQSG